MNQPIAVSLPQGRNRVLNGFVHKSVRRIRQRADAAHEHRLV